jgi:tellurite methyltransferase
MNGRRHLSVTLVRIDALSCSLMAKNDRARWDLQHGETPGAQAPSKFLQEMVDSDHWNLRRGKTLDIAAGKGRNALFLASRGFQVTAIDISAVGLEQGRKQAEALSLSIAWEEADLENMELAPAQYDLILDFNYLQRSLIPQIIGALRPGGQVIFETYLIDQQAVGHPKNPEYLLGHGELLNHFREFRILQYHEGRFADVGEPSFRAGLLAQKIG